MKKTRKRLVETVVNVRSVEFNPDAITIELNPNRQEDTGYAKPLP